MRKMILILPVLLYAALTPVNALAQTEAVQAALKTVSDPMTFGLTKIDMASGTDINSPYWRTRNCCRHLARAVPPPPYCAADGMPARMKPEICERYK